MKVNEVRFNNWVNFKFKGVDYGNVMIDKNYFSHYENKDCEYTPIPLTEEWLVKGDLLKTKLEFVNRYFIDDDFSIDYNRTHKTFHFNISCDYSVSIEFVHEWQNLYLDLTKIELKL